MASMDNVGHDCTGFVFGTTLEPRLGGICDGPWEEQPMITY
jgi:hypothetical protein